MTTPSILFLDVGGVLLTNGWDERARTAAAAAFALDLDALEQRHRLAFPAYEEGRLALREYLRLVVFDRPRSFSPEAFREFMLAQSKAYPEMIDLVRGLKARHRLRVATVSNEGRELAEHRTARFGLRSFVDVFVSSGVVGRRKPDPSIYRLALDLVQARPEEVVYVEDRALFAEVAASFGVRSITHVSREATERALAQIGLG